MDEGLEQPARPLRGRRTAVVVALIMMTAAVAVGVLIFRPLQPGRGPAATAATAVSPEQYRALVSAFYTGVAAMAVDDNDRAKAQLARATELAPGEPAAWANLGLMHLRLGDSDAAARELQTAGRLAPQSGRIEMLLGLLAERRGDLAASVAHFRRATELDPADLRARHALMMAVERQGGPDSTAQVRQQFDAVLKARPDNLAVLLDAIRAAVKRGDTDAARDLVGRVDRLSGRWPPEIRRRLEALKQAAAGPDVRSAAAPAAFLRNVLLQLPEFRADVAAVQAPTEQVGEPIERFLTLPAPRSTPAPADTSLTFQATPLEDLPSDDGWACVTAGWLDADGPSVVFVANGREVRRVTRGAAGETAMPFPGGPSATPPSPHGVLVVDWTNDFRSGLVLSGAGGVRLLRHVEKGGFEDVTAASLGSDPVMRADCYGAWAADVDLEGDLDVVLALRDGPPIVLRNNSDGTFVTIRPFTGVSSVREFVWADLDGDGDPDAAFLDAAGTLSVLTNERAGTFRPRPLPGTIGTVAAIATGDIDRDGVLDLLALTAAARVLRISDRREGSEWDVATLAAGAVPSPQQQRPTGASGAGFAAHLFAADVDNNGAADLIASGAGGTQVWLGEPDGTFTRAAAPPPQRVFGTAQRSAAGGLELLGLSADDQPVRVAIHGTKDYHWQAVRPRARALRGDGRINSFGIGGEIELRAGLLWQKATIASGAVHFGLGDNPQADVIRIVWPNGSVQAEFNLKPDQTVAAEQRLKGSCPMLFAHDGRRVRFVTDLIWRSPLGLRINAQDTAAAMQTEDWVKVGRDRLAPVDGDYDLRVTAELWETHYFDHLSLMVVDHPAGTEVFVDERFAVPQPPLKVFLTTPPRPVSTATDHHGNDVTARVVSRDGKHPDAIGRGEYQGITSDHWVEVELGPEFPVDRPLALLGFGWVHPTDSSINVAIAQGRHAAPRGLSIEVPDGRGGWTAAREGLGFPAGKNKTVVLPLDGLWKPGEPRRLRLRTNLEVYWDWLACAGVLDGGAAAGAVETRRLVPREAELRHRGFSVIAAADEHSPELPDYDRMLGTLPRWRDLVGYYTRFGDVRELLAKVDDRYVIMNAGDEMRLRFTAPPPPGSGRVRDFVVIADGWEKDGDYNTAFSKTVLPLPRHDWPAYDADPGSLEADPAYRRNPQDWVNYHTRYVGPEHFRNVARPRE